MDTETVPDPDPLLGETIAGYRVTSLIGEGGMGRVYRAVLPSINAQVAIKVLSIEVASEPDIAERFIAEAKIANLVRHDGLVNVIGLGVVPDGRPYQIMELLHGATLAELIRERGKLPLGTACVALCEALRALGALHAAGVVHRDVKSSNLFITTAGHVKLIDFGVAKLVASHGLTRSGQTLGTPEYMAPEQIEGGPIDERADLYSLGVVLYEVATGQRPFKGRVLEAFAQRAKPPATNGPAGLDDVIEKAMAPERADRFGDAGEMEAALKAFADTLPASLFSPFAEAPPVSRLPEAPTSPARPSRPPPGDDDDDKVTDADRAAGDDKPVPVVDVRDDRDAPTRPSAQQKLGRYEIKGVLGKGAAGIVMEGFDPLIQRRVALKVLHPNKSHRDRLLREAQAMAKVADPNIVTLYELGDDGSRMFLAMELVDGTDLASWLKTVRTWQDIVRVFVESGRGLEAAHAGGIVHRDFKPANVLIGRDGRPRVGDFGLALAAGGGTPAYMAPEQVDGFADARSDQFAFCASLWEALHGELPFGGASVVSLAMAARAGSIRAPKQASPVDAILRKGLAGRGDGRHDSMTTLLAELERALIPKPKRWPLVAAAAVLAMIGAAALTVALVRRHAPPDVALLEPIKKLHDPGGVLRALATSPDALVETAEARQLAADAAAAGPTRDFTASSTITGMALASDGKRLVIGSRGELAVHDLTTNAPPKILVVPGTPTSMHVADSAVIVRIDETVVSVPLDGSATTTHVRCADDNSFAMTGKVMLTSADLHLVTCSSMTGTRVIDARTGSGFRIRGFVFDIASGRDLVLSMNGDDMSVHDGTTHKLLGTRPRAKGVTAAAGDLIVMSDDTTTVTVWNVETGKESTFEAEGAGKIEQLLVTRDKPAQIAVYGAAGHIDWFTEAGNRLGRITMPGDIAFSDVPLDRGPNRFVTIAGGKASVADLATNRASTLATQGKGIALSRDGSVVALANGSTATVWYPALRLPRTQAMPTEAMIANVLSSDGSHLWFVDAGKVKSVDLATGISSELTGVASSIGDAERIAIADDDTLAIASTSRKVVTYRDGQITPIGTLPDGYRWFAVVDPTHLSVADSERHLRVIGPSTDTAPCGTRPVAAMWGRRVITSGNGGTASCDVLSGSIHQLAPFETHLATMASEGDRAIVVDNGTPHLFRMSDGVEQPLPATGEVSDVHLDRGGTRAAFLDKRGEVFVVDLVQQRLISLADSTGAQIISLSHDGTRAAALVDGHVKMWFVDHPAEAHDLGQLGPLPHAGISIRVGDSSVLTTSAGMTTDGIHLVVHSWPTTLPDADQVRAWIAMIAP